MSHGAHTVHGLSLRELLPDAEFFGAADIRVTACSGDHRTCQPGDLFAALVGAPHDGHEFIPAAVVRGCQALLVERLVPAAVPQCIVADARVAYGQICQALVGDPSRRLKTIGVTGTHGKTTTCYLTAAILAAAGIPVGVSGTLGQFDGERLRTTRRTTPPAPTLARWLARSELNGCRHAVLEVSGRALRLARAAGIEFDLAAVTNVRRERRSLRSFRGYRAVKARLLQQLRPEGIAVFNVDDPVAREIARRVAGPAITVGVDTPAEITAALVEQTNSEQTFLLSHGSETIPVRTRLIGAHNVSNCLVAAAIGVVYGVELPTIVRGLEAVTAVAGRLERIECGQPFGVYVDCAATPESLETALATLRPLASGRLICVIGVGGARDAGRRPLTARVVEEHADLSVLTHDGGRRGESRSLVEDAVENFRDRLRVDVIHDRCEAIHWALSQAEPGDCVLIAAANPRLNDAAGQCIGHLTDREVARRWLYETQQQTTPRRFAA